MLFLASVGSTIAGEGVPSAAPRAAPAERSQRLLIPAAAGKVEMITPVLLPSGPGPHPLAVVNHGTTENDELRADYAEPSFEIASGWLLAHGYAVALPQRPGHGKTGGPYLESAHGCADARFEQAGYATADSIEAAVTYLLAQPFMRKQPPVVVGHSAGAWGALALASRSKGLVAGVINFAGGRGGRSYGVANRNCAPDRLVGAAAYFGSTTRVPTLWLYAQNDSFFGPDLSRRMAVAFRSAGGAADYSVLPAVEEEGHYLIYYAEAVPYWGPIAERFLARLRR